MATKKKATSTPNKKYDKAGQPTKYKPEYCQLLIDHMAKGLSYEAFSGAVSVNLDTLYQWEKDQPKFSEAKKIALGKGRMFWEEAGLGGMKGKGDYSRFNSTVWVFTMKNRFKWHDNVQIETKTDPNAPTKSDIEKLSQDLINAVKIAEEFK